MLKKKYRLKKYSSIIATYRNNNVIFDSYMSIYFGKEKTSPEFDTRIAFVVSKRIHKRAVVRNRIKRLMRESFRLMMKNSQIDNIYKYMSVVCVAKTKAIGAAYTDINTSLVKLLSQKQ